MCKFCSPYLLLISFYNLSYLFSSAEGKFAESILLQKLFDGHRLEFYKRESCKIEENVGNRLAKEEQWDQEKLDKVFVIHNLLYCIS